MLHIRHENSNNELHHHSFAGSKLMISTGYPTFHSQNTEVIDLEDSSIICQDLHNFPMAITGAIGANLASMPIICGGKLKGYINSDININVDSSDKCFKYVEGGWQSFVTMMDRRHSAAGIVYNNAFHIFGGYDNYPNSYESTRLQSSEIINEDGSITEGPQLPIAISNHAIASINSTVSIITTGSTNANYYSDGKTWYFNHATQEFQPGPNLLEARDYHSMGTITDQHTKEKTVIVAGGFGEDGLDSTEMFINGEWVTGTNHI